MSFANLIIALKGGAGSGNWGHSGRPGKIGGSNRGGGLKRIGATPSHDIDARKKLAGAFRANASKVRPVINQVAKELGYDPRMIEYAGKPFNFTVGGLNYTAGGTYSPDTRRIRLYEGAFTSDMENVYKGLVAHEIQHDRWNSFMKRAQEQRNEVNSRLQEEQKQGVHYRNSFMKPDGTFRDPADNKRYSAYIRQYDLTDDKTLKVLRKSDGVTGYSASYWTQFEKTGKTDHYYRAIDETIAEVASLKTSGQWDKVKSPWKKFYTEMRKYAEP